jgi:hypothetical protein
VYSFSRNSNSAKNGTVPGVLFRNREKKRGTAEKPNLNRGPPECAREEKTRKTEQERRGAVEKPNLNRGPPEGAREKKPRKKE